MIGEQGNKGLGFRVKACHDMGQHSHATVATQNVFLQRAARLGSNEMRAVKLSFKNVPSVDRCFNY